MARRTFGAFKEIYRGQGIYWQDGSYNTEGSGSYPSIASVKEAIDHHIDEMEARELTARQAKASSGKYIVAKRVGEGAVFSYPDGTDEHFKTMREARRVIFDREDQFQTDILWI